MCRQHMELWCDVVGCTCQIFTRREDASFNQDEEPIESGDSQCQRFGFLIYSVCSKDTMGARAQYAVQLYAYCPVYPNRVN
jgi:hypothetical protein